MSKRKVNLKNKDLYEKRIDGEIVFPGKRIYVIKDQVELPDGNTGIRIVVRHPGAVGIVALHEGQIVMVRQFRYAVGQALWEIPAGKLEAGEDPIVCAQRELREETGYRGDLVPLGKVFTTPGFSDEMIHLFLARNLTWDPLTPDADEFLSVEAIPWEEAVSKAEQGFFADGKTIIGILWANGRIK